MKLSLHIQPPATGSAGRTGRGSRRGVSTAAFTMIEIAMALAIIGFALVAILGILPMGLDVQKNNRRETIINQDANFLIETLRGGAHGVDDLTNYVINLTNFWTRFDGIGNNRGSGYDEYDYTNSTVAGMRLTNGTRIVGLLGTPKYVTNAATVAIGAGAFQSNYLVADFRAMSGVAVEKSPQNSATILDAAFSYRLIADLTPYGVTSNGMFYSAWTNFLDPAVVNNSANITAGVSNWVAGLNDLSTNANPAVTHYINASDVKANMLDEFVSRADRWLLTRNLQPNLYELRLVFRWPLLPGNRVGGGRQVYRAMLSGAVSDTNALAGNLPGTQLWFVRPQNYIYQQTP